MITPRPLLALFLLSILSPPLSTRATDTSQRLVLPVQVMKILTRNDFKTSRRLSLIPTPVRHTFLAHDLLLQKIPVDGEVSHFIDSPEMAYLWMAGPSDDFNDHPAGLNDSPIPSRRLSFVGLTKDYCILHYESKHPKVALFRLYQDTQGQHQAILVAVFDLDHRVRTIGEMQNKLKAGRYVVDDMATTEM